MIRKILVFILVAAFMVVMALGVVAGVAWASRRIAEMPSQPARAAATIAEIVAAVLWLLGTVFLATRLAVIIFAERHADPGSPDK